MIIKRIEEWSHLELEEVATEQMKEEDKATYMMITRVTREEMGAEMTPGE